MNVETRRKICFKHQMKPGVIKRAKDDPFTIGGKVIATIPILVCRKCHYFIEVGNG